MIDAQVHGTQRYEGSEVPTFQQNMRELREIKQQLIGLQHTYSREYGNYHQAEIIKKLRQQVQQYQRQVQQLQSQVKAANSAKGEKIQQLQKERRQLEEVNVKLVECNDKLVSQLQGNNQQLIVVTEELEKERAYRKEMQSKFNRDIQNMKLMYSQELYILRKKDKKTGSTSTNNN